MEVFQNFETFAVNLSWRGFPLIPELRRSVFVRGMCVAKAVAAVRTGELAIDVNRNSGLTRSWARVVARKDSRRHRRDDERLRFGEEAQRDAHWFVFRRATKHPPVERIGQDAAKPRGGEREKVAPAHGAEYIASLSGGESPRAKSPECELQI